MIEDNIRDEILLSKVLDLLLVNIGSLLRISILAKFLYVYAKEVFSFFR